MSLCISCVAPGPRPLERHARSHRRGWGLKAIEARHVAASDPCWEMQPCSAVTSPPGHVKFMIIIKHHQKQTAPWFPRHDAWGSGQVGGRVVTPGPWPFAFHCLYKMRGGEPSRHRPLLFSVFFFLCVSRPTPPAHSTSSEFGNHVIYSFSHSRGSSTAP